MPIADASRAPAPASTGTLYLPIVRSFRFSGTILFHTVDPSNVAVVNAANFAVTTLAPGQVPAWSPDGSKIAFLDARGNPKATNLYVMNADGSGQTKLSDSLAFLDTPRWSPDGTKILFPATPDVLELDWAIINADGSGERSLFGTFGGDDPVWSPDGTRIAFAGPDDDIYVMNADGSGTQRLVEVTSVRPTPLWSPDGSKIVFTAYLSGIRSVFVINADGSGLEQLSDGRSNCFNAVWSPDGNRIAYLQQQAPFQGSIVVMNADSTGQRVLWSDTTSTLVFSPVWSPDGNALAFPVWGSEATGLWAASTDGMVRANLTGAAHPNILVSSFQWRE
jgi:TolB protein